MAHTLTPTTGSHLVLYDISWEIYEQLLELFAEHPALRMTYHKGTLELMTPLPEHRNLWLDSRATSSGVIRRTQVRNSGGEIDDVAFQTPSHWQRSG
jgi:hypothetical protein